MAKQKELKAAISEMQKNIVDHIELTQIRARLCREYYEHLIMEGFTKQEALELCKTFHLGG